MSYKNWAVRYIYSESDRSISSFAKKRVIQAIKEFERDNFLHGFTHVGVRTDREVSKALAGIEGEELVVIDLHGYIAEDPTGADVLRVAATTQDEGVDLTQHGPAPTALVLACCTGRDKATRDLTTPLETQLANWCAEDQQLAVTVNFGSVDCCDTFPLRITGQIINERCAGIAPDAFNVMEQFNEGNWHPVLLP